jgi:CheY-like chemotaxis protein
MDSPIRVMLADQSSEQTELLRAALEDAGFAVVAAVGTGDEALEQLRAAAPDVLVTDLLLPGLDGLSLLHRAKEAGFLPHTIILSAFWNDRLARAAMRLGGGRLPAEALPRRRPVRAHPLARDGGGGAPLSAGQRDPPRDA